MSRRTVVVGFDGSDRALDALRFADRLCTQSGWRLVLAGVYPYRPLRQRFGSGDRAAAELNAARRRITGACETQIAPGGTVSDGLQAIANSVRADLIVLGSRHRGRLGEALPGRTARALIRGGSRGIVIVPAGHHVREIRHVGVLGEDSDTGREASAIAAVLASDVGASLTVHGGHVPPQASGSTEVATSTEIADELARGQFDVLVVPSWPHGLLGRLRRAAGWRATERSAGCPVLVAARPRREPTLRPPSRPAEAGGVARR
jgi:nucleotide-binding universal stress UspA family protein